LRFEVAIAEAKAFRRHQAIELSNKSCAGPTPGQFLPRNEMLPGREFPRWTEWPDEKKAIFF